MQRLKINLLQFFFIFSALIFYSGPSEAIKNVSNSCQLRDEGYVGTAWKEIVIVKDQQPIQGANTHAEAISQLKELVRSGACRNIDQECHLQGEGSVSGVWKKHRVFLGGSAVFGTDDLEDLMEIVRDLRQLGLCLN